MTDIRHFIWTGTLGDGNVHVRHCQQGGDDEVQPIYRAHTPSQMFHQLIKQSEDTISIKHYLNPTKQAGCSTVNVVLTVRTAMFIVRSSVANDAAITHAL